MARGISVVAALLLTACAKPQVTDAYGDSVTIRYDAVFTSRQEVAGIAARECAELGAVTAHHVSTGQDGPYGLHYSTYRCEFSP